MDTPREYRQRAADCFRLAKEASDVYVAAALTELAIDFRKMADSAEKRAVGGARA